MPLNKSKDYFRDFSSSEIKVFRKFKSPRTIQDFIDKTSYRSAYGYFSPRDVIRDGLSNCFDGALFGAAALKFLGYQAMLWDLRAEHDDDHVLAIFSDRGHWGAVGKSNFVGLRYRDPIYRSLRELAMSYFEVYYNVKGEKTLRAYSLPLKLSKFDSVSWMTERAGLERIAAALDDMQHFKLFPAWAKKCVAKVDSRSLKAGLRGANSKGLYKP